MKQARHAKICNMLIKYMVTSVTPGVTLHFNSPIDIQGVAGKEPPAGVGPERDVTRFIYKGSVTCHSPANAHSTRPPSVTVSRSPHPQTIFGLENNLSKDQPNVVYK